MLFHNQTYRCAALAATSQLAGGGDGRHMARMMVPRLRLMLMLGVIVSAAALFVATASEWWGGLVPCALCLVERWPYRAAVAFGLLGLVLPRRLARLALLAVILALLAATAAGLLHVGVEQGWWPSPLPECMAPTLYHGTMAERLAHMPAQPSKACEDPTFLIPALPVSMAQMNLILALALAAILATFGWRTRRSQP